ncbi:hypothetical protein L204_102836 [Cryptococcus depauperatus]
MYLTPGLKHNYSLYAIPTGWLIGMAPLWWAIFQTNKTSPGVYSNAKPKESWTRLHEAGLSPKLYGRITRAIAANDNTHTNLALFAACLVAANAAHVHRDTLHACVATWIGSRIAYTLAYVMIEEDKCSWIRSGLYFTGIFSCFTLVVKAADRFKSLTW